MLRIYTKKNLKIYVENNHSKIRRKTLIIRNYQNNLINFLIVKLSIIAANVINFCILI